MYLSPCGAVIVMTVTKQKAGQLLLGVAQAAYGSQASPDQVPHRLMSAVGNPYRCELACAMEPGQLHRVPAIGLDPVAWATGDQRWCDHNAIMAGGGHLTLDTIPHGPAS